MNITEKTLNLGIQQIFKILKNWENKLLEAVKDKKQKLFNIKNIFIKSKIV